MLPKYAIIKRSFFVSIESRYNFDIGTSLLILISMEEEWESTKLCTATNGKLHFILKKISFLLVLFLKFFWFSDLKNQSDTFERESIFDYYYVLYSCMDW